MHIAIDIREATRTKTGKGWYAFVLVNELLKQDSKNRYILYSQRRAPEFEKYPNAEQRFFPQSGLLWHWKVLRDVKKNKPEFFWAPTSYLIAALAPRNAGLKTLITVHDLVAFVLPVGHSRKAMWMERLTLRYAIQKAHKIITVSHNTKKDLKTLFEISDEKIVLTPCAARDIFKPIAATTLKEKVQKKYELPAKFILAVGTLSPRKNFTRLIQAYRQIAAQHPDVHLVIVGDEGWKFDQIIKEARRNDSLEPAHNAKIHLVGYIQGEELAVVYNLATLFVFPSLYEGFGIPPLEAMACGCPVIVSNNSSLPEVVNGAARLIDPYSVEDIAKAIDEMLSDPTQRREWIQKGFEQAKQFSWGKSAETVLKTFEDKK